MILLPSTVRHDKLSRRSALAARQANALRYGEQRRANKTRRQINAAGAEQRGFSFACVKRSSIKPAALIPMHQLTVLRSWRARFAAGLHIRKKTGFQLFLKTRFFNL
jgi:hypothetical protein